MKGCWEESRELSEYWRNAKRATESRSRRTVESGLKQYRNCDKQEPTSSLRARCSLKAKILSKPPLGSTACDSIIARNSYAGCNGGLTCFRKEHHSGSSECKTRRSFVIKGPGESNSLPVRADRVQLESG